MLRHRGYGPSSWGLLEFGALSVLAIVVLVLMVWALSRLFRRRSSGWGQAPRVGPMQGSSALRILDERLARGEIDVESYRLLREELTRASPTPPPMP